ncbi:type VII secretion system-associated protein [Streptomyces sp. NPDC001276]|uniref:type VII secretion system-associated protein n=1 Tax=Streptomyces sp. NPDC001276 TaxID=3364555 RepID=UPI0036B49A03
MTDVVETTERDEPMADVPDAIREAAKAAPDHWFGMVDPAWRGGDAPPNWAVVGQYRSDTDGEVVEWQYNDDYRPSPSANGWPPPTDPVDEAIQLAATGYGPEQDVFRLLTDAEVDILLGPDDSPVTARDPDGAPVVPVFTSTHQLRSGGRYASRTVLVRDLLGDLVDNTHLYVNPAGAVSMTVAPDQLIAVEERSADAQAVAPRTEANARPDDDADGNESSGSAAADPGKHVGQMETLHLPVPEPAPEAAQASDGDSAEDEARTAGTTELSAQDYLVNVLSGGGGEEAR